MQPGLNYNKRRVEGFKSTQSKITEAGLYEELKKKLFPAIKSMQDATDRLKSINTMKAIPLCITTRQIDFGTSHIFLSLNQFNNLPA